MLGVSSAGHVFSTTLVFFMGGGISLLISSCFRVPKTKALVLYVWHTVFALVYIVFSLNNVADATNYYIASLEYNDFGIGTSFVYFFTSFFSVPLQLSYPGVFLVYNIIGFVGLLGFYGALRQTVKPKSMGLKWMAWGVVMLPSVSFWSSAIGKDAISFMAIGLSLWSAIDLNRRKGLMAFAVLAMFLVRPHMASIMVAAIGGAIIFDRKANPIGKLSVAIMALFAGALIVPFAIRYAGLVDVLSVMDYIDQRQGSNMGGGSSLDIASMSLPLQLFTYLFRPFPFEASNVFVLITSLENLLLLIIMLSGLLGWARWGLERSYVNVAYLLIYALIAWLILAVTTANLGIAARQKWMFMPYLILLSFCCLKRIPLRIGRPRFRKGSRVSY